MMNNKVSFTNSNNPTISLSAVIYFPPKFDETRQYQAIVVSHPGGGVKEQTAGTYAKKLAEKGFVTIAYDASYQGESGGEPRQLENPYIRTEDISAVIDYLTTLSYRRQYPNWCDGNLCRCRIYSQCCNSGSPHQGHRYR
ncbi:hypothetical protein VEE15_08970 [Escherichia coli]|nr:hypothetical protein VEE15_08970 [Escherichia coli]